jgi:hypothetical protein
MIGTRVCQIVKSQLRREAEPRREFRAFGWCAGFKG